MKKSRMLLATVMAASLLPSLAFAQDHDDHRDDRGQAMEHRDQGARGGMDHRDDRRMGMDHHQFHHEWHRGDRLPQQYWDHRYVIGDWRAYHLSPPPYGYNWVNVDGDYVLVQIGTGVVLQMGF